MDNDTIQIIKDIEEKNPNEPEFIQAVTEILEVVVPYLKENYLNWSEIVKNITTPDRVLTFDIEWEDDDRKMQKNKAYRVQFSNILGPYKGGLRFHPSVNLSILKFLAFEQIFKNSLTGLPLGGGKGGSDFDPKGKSDEEVGRFCYAFMEQLYSHIGAEKDVPAGDIGVGAREIRFLFEKYKELGGKAPGVLTGKPMDLGGSEIRTEATGYGAVYFAKEMLKEKGMELKNKTVCISGSGNVAQYAAEKCIELEAKVVTMSDSSGHIYDPEGLTAEKLEWIKDLKNNKRGRIQEYAEKFGVEFKEGSPWGYKCDIAMPCATQNELDEADAKHLVENDAVAIVEGANMPTTAEAIEVLKEKQVLFAPGKASNAGGVGVSGLEMEQNAKGEHWSREEVDTKLKNIMKHIHDTCVKYGKTPDGHIDYVVGANIGGLVRIIESS